jgi:hypothetical protein
VNRRGHSARHTNNIKPLGYCSFFGNNFKEREDCAESVNDAGIVSAA